MRRLPRKGVRVSPWWLPVVLVLGFVGVFGWVFRERLLPGVPVTVVRAELVVAGGGEEVVGGEPLEVTGDEPGPMLFQAAGWLEPDPLPIRATALTDGVVAKVHVLEGQEIARGELIAELIAEDVELDLRSAERAVEVMVAEHHMHLAEIPAVEAEAEEILDEGRAAEARLAELKDTEARLEKLSQGTVSVGELTRARLAVQAQEAEVAAIGSRHRGALAKLKAIEAKSAVFEAKIAEAEVAEDVKRLARERTKILSPVDGVVLELMAAPGQKKMIGMDDPDSATVAVLFEKGKLQARVDVPLSEARGLVPGQAALVTTDFLPDVEFRGVVVRIVGAADLQRNTLQAKVRVVDPDPRLRPEMLCRVKFLGSGLEAGRGEEGSGGGDQVVMVPEKVVEMGEGKTGSAWVVDAGGDAVELRKVVLGSRKKAGYISVESGVLAGELLVVPPFGGLEEGKRVRVKEEEKD